MLSSFKLTICAFASIIWPKDPLVAVAWPGVEDVAAGDLKRTVNGGLVETFDVQVVRLYELAATGALAPSGLYIQEGVGVVTPEQGEDFFAELDAQAQAAGHATFAAWYAADAAGAAGLIGSIIGLSVAPITPIGGPEALFLLYTTAWRIVGLAYWSNFPGNRVRNNMIGFGPEHGAQPIYSDPVNKVANPNVRSVGQGGDATETYAWNYRAYPWPPRQGLRELHRAALLDWDKPGSEAAYEQLIAAYEDGSAIAL